MTSANTAGGSVPEGLGHIENEKPVFDTPGVGELQDVDDDTAAAVVEQLEADGHPIAQPADHPYDPDGDPDSEPDARQRADTANATTPSADGMHYDRSAVQRAGDDRRFEALRAAGKDAMTLDPGLPAAAPRAGG